MTSIAVKRRNPFVKPNAPATEVISGPSRLGELIHSCNEYIYLLRSVAGHSSGSLRPSEEGAPSMFPSVGSLLTACLMVL
jgi:hypothetical protein